MPMELRQLATCIEHEWGDVLYPAKAIMAEDYLEDPESSLDGILPSPFHRDLAIYASRYLSAKRLETPKVIEIGGGAGRFAYEFLLFNRFVGEYHYSDPSEEKVSFARWIFGEGESWREVPQLASTLGVRKRGVSRPQIDEDVVRQIKMHQRTAESPEWEEGSADLVISLNVIDHVEDPAAFMTHLHRLLKPGGLLLLASPLDWHTELTRRELWREDLKDFLGDQWQVLAERSMPYFWRSRLRRLIIFASQVLLVQAKS